VGLLSVLTVLVPYFVMLGLQILSEILHYAGLYRVGDGTLLVLALPHLAAVSGLDTPES